MSSVKVAVRVRPLNKRENEMQCRNVIQMVGCKTIIQNPKCVEEEAKEFTFDHSYWSFDTKDVDFASQSMVFQQLGKDIVSDAIEGYNSCIFAYGQTGSGKTHTMMGEEANEGLIPRICRWLFEQTNSLRTGTNPVTYKTEISYLEIYNEQVRDLLDNNQNVNNSRKALKVREHPTLGPYVEKLSRHMVHSYKEISHLMQKGNYNRTTAATNMNDTSSRSHAIFTIMFSKASYVADNPYETMSKINLVDLAGSERANATKAEGQRLVEGSHINKSLVTLGNVISTLAQKCKNNSNKKIFIPYRNSILTWLLKDSLGGNSKTIMIATISPADINYSETLNTLRYANRAKNILNQPHINEDSNTKLIRELRLEIERLNSMINHDPQLTERLHMNEAKVKELTEEWVDKWNEVKNILQEQNFIALRKSGEFGVVLDSDRPHLIVCVDDDLLSTGVRLYHLNVGSTHIGTKFASQKQDILINSGDDVEDEHCRIEWDPETNVVTLHPLGKALCFVNNSQVDKATVLHQGCFIVFGENMFRFSNPLEVKSLKEVANDSSPVDTSLLSRPSRLISSTSYDSLYNSISSLNKKTLMSSFASSLGMNGNEENTMQISKDELRQTELDQAREELKFLKLFLLELRQTLNHEPSEQNQNVIKSFLDIVLKIGQEEQFSKELILQTLQLIHKIDSGSTNMDAIRQINHFLSDKLNLLKRNLPQELKLDCVNNNYSLSNVPTPTTIATVSNANGNLKEVTKEETEELEQSTYQQLCQLALEVESRLDFLNNQCVPTVEESLISSTITDEDNTTLLLNTDSQLNDTKTSDQFGSTLEYMIEQEVQRRIEKHLHVCAQQMPFAEFQLKKMSSSCSLTDSHLAGSRVSLLTATSAVEQVGTLLSPEYEELDQITIYIPAFHYQLQPDEHYEYEIKISINGDRWTIYRRYSCFLQLHKFVRQRYSNQIKVPYFPPKRWRNMSSKLVELRRRFLENYLQQVLELCKLLPDCPLNYRFYGLDHLDRQCLYAFNSFFQMNLLVDKQDRSP